MKRIVLIGLVLLALTACRQPNRAVEGHFLMRAQMTKGSVFTPQEFQLDLKEQTIKVDRDGNISSGHLNKSINIGENFYVRKINFYEYENQVIIFFEITNDEVASNMVYCLDRHTFNTSWTASLWTFNLTVGQCNQGILYLGAGENAYALDIKTGKILWQTEGLYHLHGFYSFDSISLVDNTILLTGKSHREIVKTAVLDKTSGKILSVE